MIIIDVRDYLIYFIYLPLNVCINAMNRIKSVLVLFFEIAMFEMLISLEDNGMI